MTPNEFFSLVRIEGLSGPNIWASLCSIPLDSYI